MTLDEVIRRYTSNAEYDRIHGSLQECLDFRQLAEWLKDYKRLLEPKTGHWTYICNSEVNGLKIVECSECGKRTYGSGNYCPNCGAKMEESDK